MVPLHCPMTQVGVAPVQTRPHMPQLAGSDVISTQLTPPMLPGHGTFGAMHAPPFAGAHVPLPFGSEMHTDEQHADELWQPAPSGAQGGSFPKSTPTVARPFGCMERVT